MQGLTDLIRVFNIIALDSDAPDYPLLALDLHPHRLSVSFSVPHDAPAGPDDEESPPVDFGLLSETLLNHSRRREKFQGAEELAAELCQLALGKFDAVSEVEMIVGRERLDGQTPRRVVVTAHRARNGLSDQDTVFVGGMDLEVMVKIHEWERMERNVVDADISLQCDPWQRGEGVDIPGLVASLYDGVSKSDDLTLESLASSLARMALSYDIGVRRSSRRATVKLTKPKAIPLSDFVEVEVTRTAEYFATPHKQRLAPVKVPLKPSTHAKATSTAGGPSKHVAAIAIGSNVGDRYANIENGLRQMESRHEIISITDTSFLYESEPMYVLNQDKFLNCAIMVETTLRPTDLLTLLKHLESIVGRTKSLRHGPRAIDLDIIFYDSIIFDTRKDGGDGSGENELVIPHLRLREREFVLRPLHDLIPDYIHPFMKITVRDLLNAYLASHPSTLRKILPFPAPPHHPHIPTTLWPLASKTYLMATINATPDSFSSSAPSTPASALAEGLAAAAAGADIIDIGGYSTRPGAAPVPAAEEIRRVVPAVRALREHGVMLPISVDTFRSAVLRAAVEAGANCLNDVTALAGDPGDGAVEGGGDGDGGGGGDAGKGTGTGMRRSGGGSGDDGEMALAVRELGVPVVMMHSRGAHRAGEDKAYGTRGVVAGVQGELGVRVRHALRCGIRRWHLLVDPGFGFSKTAGDNVVLLRRLGELTTAPGVAGGRGDEDGDGDVNALRGFPTLAGLSRKSFLGKTLGRETQPQEREWATAAAVTAAVQQGVDVVRVHDVAEMRDVVCIADAVWREGRDT